MKSEDSGAPWFPITEGLNVNQEFYNIIVDPEILFLATFADGVFISRNASRKWEPWNKGLTVLMVGTNRNNVTNVLAMSVDERWLYFGTAGASVWKRKLFR